MKDFEAGVHDLQEKEDEMGEDTAFYSDGEGGGALEGTETQEEEVVSGREQVRGAEYISRRAYRSETVMKIPGMAAGGRGYKSLSSGLQPMNTGEYCMRACLR